MTPERAKELLPIIAAFAEGRLVEYLYPGTSGWEKRSSLSFDASGEYRIAPDPPQPKWRAWTISEIREIYLRERLVVVNKRGAECCQEVVGLLAAHIRLGNDGLVLPEALFNGYERIDGSPCGVKE